jgi:heptosyltransferase-2
MTADRPPGIPARLLVRAPNWLGDAVMALPAIGAMRAACRESTLAVAAVPAVAPLFEEITPAAQDEMIVLPPGAEPLALGEGRFDAALLLPNSFRAAWVARGARVPERWGFAAGARGFLLTRAVPRPRGKVHQSAYYLALVRGLGWPAPEEAPRIRLRPRTRERGDDLLRQSGVGLEEVVVGFAPGAAYGHAKRWPPARVARVIERGWRERGAVAVLVGASGDRDAGREIESSLASDIRVVNLIGRTDLRLLMGVIGRCRAFVSNDSGGMHLAAAIGVPVVAAFGPTDERVTAPLGDHDVLIHQVFCRPCMLRDCPIDHRCMKGITADAVYAAVARRLDAAPAEAGLR